MSAAAALAIFLASVSQSEASSIRVAPRPVLDVVFDAPKTGIANASRSDMLRAVSTSVLASTDLAAREAPGIDLDPCFRTEQAAPLLCVLRRLRPRFDAARSATPTAPFETLWSRTRDPNEAPSSDLVLLVQYAPVLERERVQAILLDLRAMGARYTAWMAEGAPSRANRDATEAGEAALQEELFEVGVLTPPMARDVANAREVRAFMDEVLIDKFASIFTRRGFRRFATIEVTAPADARLFVDERLVGSTAGPVTALRDVPPGPHTIRIEHPNYLAYQDELTVAPLGTRKFSPVLVPAPSAAVRNTREVMLWTGVATVAGGIAVLGATAAQPSSGLSCAFDDLDGCPPNGGFKELGPVLGAPLGYSMIGAGAIWTTLCILREDDPDWPWWEFLVGLAVAGASYGISVAANPDAPQPTQ